MRNLRAGATGIVTTSLVFAIACGGGNGTPADAGSDANGDVAGDTSMDAAGDVPIPTDLSPDVPIGTAPDAHRDVPVEVVLPETLGGDRPSALFLPDDYDPAKAWPLIVVLHGYTLGGLWESMYFGLPERVTPKGFVLAAPDGTVDLQGKPFWNASPSCCNFNGSDVDDVAYLRSLIAEAKQSLNIDPGRVYLLGHSNGGFMSLRMACDASDVIVGIATLGASMAVEQTCTPSRPVSILLIHGTDDETIAYGGGTFGGLAPFVGAEALFEDWRNRDGCQAGPLQAPTAQDYDSKVVGAETSPAGWSDCTQDTRVDLWKMVGSGHNPPFTEAFKDGVIDHLLSLGRAAP